MRDTTHELIRRLGECEFTNIRGRAGEYDLVSCEREDTKFNICVDDKEIRANSNGDHEGDYIYIGNSPDECVIRMDDMLCNMRGEV